MKKTKSEPRLPRMHLKPNRLTEVTRAPKEPFTVEVTRPAGGGAVSFYVLTKLPKVHADKIGGVDNKAVIKLAAGCVLLAIAPEQERIFFEKK